MLTETPAVTIFTDGYITMIWVSPLSSQYIINAIDASWNSKLFSIPTCTAHCTLTTGHKLIFNKQSLFPTTCVELTTLPADWAYSSAGRVWKASEATGAGSDRPRATTVGREGGWGCTDWPRGKVKAIIRSHISHMCKIWIAAKCVHNFSKIISTFWIGNFQHLPRTVTGRVTPACAMLLKSPPNTLESAWQSLHPS